MNTIDGTLRQTEEGKEEKERGRKYLIDEVVNTDSKRYPTHKDDHVSMKES